MARSFGRCIVVAAIAVLLVSVFCNGCGSTPEAIDVALPGDVGTDTSDGGDMHGLDSEDPDAGCGQCQAGYTCIAGKCTCVPACTGKECGNDGCGGQCGACPAIAPVCVDGLCASDCTADCAGIECGDDGCGGICGECDDDLACTQDSCTSGACAHSVQPFFCVIDNICVPSGTKNPAEPCQVCSPAKEAGGWSQEEDWVPCGTGKVCLAGLCSIDCTWLCKDVECGSVEQGGECECGGCDDGNECTDDSCEENQCVFSANSSVCDDGNPCTGPDKCSEGGCAGAILPPDELVDLDCLCQADVDCQALDDGNACNGNLMCDNSAVPPVCVIAPGSILDCQDDNPCTSDSCDPELGCVFLVDPTGDCSDGNECNGKEACEGGGCVPGAPPVCDDSNPCTTDSCGETAGCTFAPDDSLSCSDGNECNGAEACMSGKCALGQPMACDDNDPCTKDFCVPGLGCQHAQDDAACDDGLFCTNDGCSQGSCVNTLLPFYCIIDGCVPSGAENPLEPCQECLPGQSTTAWSYLADGMPCGTGKVCLAGSCCDHSTNCVGKECGDDGCGGTCGTCLQDWSCQAGICKQGPCVPACVGKSCGPDGCGGECGTCPANHYCAVQGVCVCLPQCAGKECGPDACGGSCGTCQAGFQCDQGKCKQGPCVPNCTGKQCGDDGCGGSCGSCDDGLSCTADSCSLGKCLNAIDPFYCVVKGSCVPSGTEDPDSVCRKCLPKKSQTEWSNVDDQTPCGGGGLACYKGVCCIYNCSGKECGSDGCGGSCGSCLPGISCNAGLCNGCNDGNAVSWDGCTNGALSEFQINTVVTGDQEKPSVAARPEGGYMVVWESKLMGTADIYGRVIADNGTPTGPEFILHASLDNWQHDSRVAALTDGRYVVVWESFVTNQVGASIWAQLINADGTKSGPEIKVNDVDGKWMTYRVDVAALDKGGFVVAWSRNQTWPLTDQSVTVRYRLIAGDGTKLASEGAFGQVGAADPEVATFGDGEFVIACRMGDTPAYPYWQRFNSVGFPLNSATKVADKATLHGISGKSDGQFVIAWNYQDSSAQPKTVFGQLYAKGTGPSGSPFQVSPSNDISNCSYVRPAMRSDGTLVVVWTSVMTGSAQPDVWLQRLDAGGLKQGGVLRPNVYTDAWQAQPDVALFGDGNVIVVWASQNQDGDGLGIFARRVDKNGNWLYH